MVEHQPLHTLLGRAQQIVDSGLDRDTKLQRICELLHRDVDYYDWVGFYLTVRDTQELLLGPFVGEPTEHTRIPFGKGICGQAAERKETFTVQDVSREANYLSCSPHVRSEIVVPILKDGHVLGELDIDSHSLSPFGPQDRELLEGICAMVAGLF
jgi:GAF domain-containing protein